MSNSGRGAGRWKVLDARLKDFCFVRLIMQITQYILTAEDPSNSVDVNERLNTLSHPGPLCRGNTVSGYKDIPSGPRLHASGMGDSRELSEPGTVSMVGTVSRDEQMTPEEWTNARHKVGECMGEGKKESAQR